MPVGTRLGPAVCGTLVAALVLLGTGALAALFAADGAQPAAAAAVGHPPVTDLSVVPHPGSARPPYLVPVVDPVFGSTITRVSDQRAFGSTSLWLRQSHAKLQPWNADGSLLLLGYTDPGFLLDGRTYAFRGKGLAHAPTGVWSNVDPDAFFAVQGNRLLRLGVSSGRWEVAHEFTAWTSLSIGDGEGSPSNDDSALALTARRGDTTAVLLYDLRRQVEVATLMLPPGSAARLDWAAVSQSGRFVVLNWLADGTARGAGVEVYDRQLRFVRHLYDVSERADLGWDASGEEAYVTWDPVRGKREGDQQVLMSVRLDDGLATVVLRTDWVGTHVSCRNTGRPGWCFLSDSAVDAPRSRTGGYDEVYAVRLDGSGAVERFAQAQQSRGVPYDWTTLAVPSRDGGRVLFASEWNRGITSPAYAYVASFGEPPAVAGSDGSHG